MLNAPSAPVQKSPLPVQKSPLPVQKSPLTVPERQIVQMSGKTKRRKKSPTLRSRRAHFEPRVAPATTSSWKDRLRRLLFTPGTLVVVAMILLGVAVVPDVPGWLPTPSSREEYRLETSRIEINTPPRYLPVEFVDQVIREAKLPKSLSLLDDDLSERIGRAFAANPWVAEVVQVRKSYPAHVEVELKYREPVAMVEVSDGVYPITEDSVLLPSVDFSLADTRLYPLIRGVNTLPQGPEGTRWKDMAVIAAARMAKVLAPHWKSLDLESINVPRRVGENPRFEDLRFDLTTHGGSRILWGRAPGTEHPGELTPKQKIERLKKYVADFGGFDNPHGPYEIDIRHWQEISRRPLSASLRSPIRR